MSYISPVKICFPGGCCPSLVTDNFSLLPFQIISEGDYIRSEISVYGSGVWTEITLPVTSVVTEGFYIHSYDGSTIAELDCGAYEFRVVAGETWWFEPFTVEDFEFTENAYKLRDLLMTPLKFSEQLVSCGSIVAPCDSFLPFMYTTENATTAPTYTLVALDGTETPLTITVDVLTIDGRTYYIHDGECFYPFLECGRYYIRIDDGGYSYFSAWFDAVCEMNDIPDGYRAMRDANGCVMRDDEGEILTEECSEIPPEFIPFIMTIDTEKITPGADTFNLPLPGVGTYDYYVDWGDGNAEEHFTTNTDQLHTYSTSGIYQISISGIFPHISFAGAGVEGRLVLSIDQWGDIIWGSMNGAFQGCQNMIGAYTDMPNTSLVTDMNSMFYNCYLFNSPVNFDTSAVTNMAVMFSNCLAFNQSLASFDTSNVTDMSDMFYGATAFNQSVAHFDTSNVEWFFYMFNNCPAFKQSLANFSLASAQDIDWMLADSDINEVGTSTNYDATLVAWAAADVPDGLVFDGGNSKYSDTGQTARNSLIAVDSWDIYDGGHI